MKALAYLVIAIISMPIRAETIQTEGDWIHTYRAEMSDPASIYNFYYDKRTAVRNGNKVAFWGKTISTSPTVPASTQYAHEFGDCDSQRSATDSLLIDGLGVFSVRVQWQTLLPNTPAMQTLLAVCKNVH
jgi:hypothetical protein